MSPMHSPESVRHESRVIQQQVSEDIARNDAAIERMNRAINDGYAVLADLERLAQTYGKAPQ